jgi:hypothetical protein
MDGAPPLVTLGARVARLESYFEQEELRIEAVECCFSNRDADESSDDNRYAELLSAVAEEELGTVKRIFKERPSVLRRSTPIEDHSIVHIAAMHRSVDVLRYLVTLRHDGRRGGLLLNFGKASLDGMNALHLACSQGSSSRSALETLQILCSVDGIDISARDGQGRTPIHFCAERGVRARLEYGLRYYPKRSFIPRCLFICFQDADAALFLFERCPSSAQKSCNIGQNALQRAAAFGRMQIVQAFVASRIIDLNAKDAEVRGICTIRCFP